MLIAAFAFDYDGTIAEDGKVDEATVAALQRLKAAGRKILLVTGRELPDLQRAFPQLGVFDVVVAENGALLYLPSTAEERPLGAPPPVEFIAALRRREVTPLSLGRSIVATWQPNETKVLDAIQELGLEWQIIFNKGAVMCLPPGVNKASGLAAALELLELSALNVVAAGDAENDHAFITACGCSVAVANAIESIKAEADIVTSGARGKGIVELVERFLDGDGLVGGLRRHDVLLGPDARQQPVGLRDEAAILIAGSSGIGKSRLASALIERMQLHRFQICVIDPEGDYQGLTGTISLGDPNRAPLDSEAFDVLRKPSANLVVNLLGIGLPDRPVFFSKLLSGLVEFRSKFGRPHWIVVDEAHHLAPAESAPSLFLPGKLPGTILITAEPERLAKNALQATNAIVAVGEEAAKVIASYCNALGLKAPDMPAPPGADEVLFWDRANDMPPMIVRVEGPSSEHRRHVRKYAKGTLGEDKSFYFRGQEGKLNLRAQNVSTFLQMAEGVDDETWLFHLQQKDYSHWFRHAIKDDDAADEIERVETVESEAVASREEIHKIISRRYTAPAET
jgi:hydroxymethylpyrimidine pyrophosphatase-like HAD family hydrolase